MKKRNLLENLKTFCLITLILTTFTKVKSQSCNLLAYEGFSYTLGSPLEAQSGSNGFSNPWLVQNNSNVVPGFQIISSGMNYLNLQTSGNAVSGGYSYLTCGRPLNISPSGPFASYVNPWGGGIGSSNSGAIFYSVLLKKTENNTEVVSVSLHSDNLVWYEAGSSNNVSVGYFGTASNVGSQKRWSLKLNGTVYPTSVPMVANSAVFMVVRIDFANTSTVNLYVNPATIGSVTPSSSTITKTTTAAFDLKSLALTLGDDPASGQIDEFRIASSYQCATPDAATAVNQAPVAILSLSPNTGIAPLAVNFNASTSFDPDGTIINYQWDFGDGSPVVNSPTNTATSHTYNTTGIITAKLSVTDNFSITSSATHTVKVLNQNGVFSCQVSLSAEKLATCNQSNGAFRVNNPNNYTLKLVNSANQTITPVTNYTYSNLPSGNYTLTVNGSNGCLDTFKVYMPTDSNSCPGWSPNPCRFKMGVGLEGFSYYMAGRLLKDYFKASGEWLTYDPTGVNTSWDTNEGSSIPLDANGYPTQCPFTAPGGQRCVRVMVSANGFFPVGVPMRLLYNGTGSVTINGTINSVTYSPGQIDFTPSAPANNIWIQIQASQQGNPINNIRIVEVSDLSTYQTQPFRQNFISKCSPFQALRFMDWMNTNNNTNISWANRTMPTYYTMANPKGVAYEYIVQLANISQKDIWICIPHMADSNYITQMATFFKNNLSPNISVYLEYSNEVWNWMFGQAGWVYNNGPQNLSYPRKYADRATNAFRLWKQIWNGSSSARLKCVLGTQNGFDWVGEEMLAQANQNDYDYLSPSCYFGLDHTSSGVPNLPALGASATATDVINNARNNFHAEYAGWKRTYNNGKLFGKEIISYEGGQHFTNFSSPTYSNAMYSSQIDPAMYNLYQEVIDSLRLLDSRMGMAFTLTGAWQSVYGSWGHIFDVDDPAPWTDRPKYQVIIDNANVYNNSNCNSVVTSFGKNKNWSNDIIVFPNPSNGNVEIVGLNESELKNSTYQVVSLNGQVVASGQLNNNNKLILNNLSNGMYFLVLRDKNTDFTQTRKLIINKN